MRWLVTGAAGMLGTDLVDLLRSRGYEVAAAARGRPRRHRPPTRSRDAVAGHDVVVNCAAWTAVDDAETHEAEALAVNARGAPTCWPAPPPQPARRLVQVSTDYVFDGRRDHALRRGRADLARARPTAAPRRPARRPSAPSPPTATWSSGPPGCTARTAAASRDHRAGRPRAGPGLASSTTRSASRPGPSTSPTWSCGSSRPRCPPGPTTPRRRGQCSLVRLRPARWSPPTAGSRGVVQPTTSDAFVRPAPAAGVLGARPRRPGGAGVEPIGDWRERWRGRGAPLVLGQSSQQAEQVVAVAGLEERLGARRAARRR